MSDIFIDSNIPIYYFEPNSRHHAKCHNLIRHLTENNLSGIVTPHIISEVHYAISKKFAANKAQIYTYKFLTLPPIKLVDFTLETTDLLKIFKLAAKYNLKTTDAFHAYYCKKLGLKNIATFDTDFANIPWLKIYSL